MRTGLWSYLDMPVINNKINQNVQFISIWLEIPHRHQIGMATFFSVIFEPDSEPCENIPTAYARHK